MNTLIKTQKIYPRLKTDHWSSVLLQEQDTWLLNTLLSTFGKKTNYSIMHGKAILEAYDMALDMVRY